MQQSGADAGNGATRRLVVMRHSKAESTAPSDHERALASRGRADAAAAGMWLAEQGITPDAALVSDAMRTRQTWAQVAGLAESAELDAARARWSKAVTKLERLQLVKRDRGAKNKVTYRLLREDGSGAEYTRPVKGSVDGHWFSIPHTYWRDGFDLSLNAAEKLMLLVSLDQTNRFRVPTDRVPSWYGLSESTAKRGYAGLVQRGILSRAHEWEEDARSPVGWRQDVYYTTEGDWSLAARDAAMRRRTPKAVVAFEDFTKEAS